MIRLGLFGGTFDPVHYGHLRPVESARVELELPKVLMLPNPQPPHKLHDPLAPYPYRKEMLRLALEEFPHLEIADFEEGARGPGYTTDTVRRILEALPNGEHELWLLIGMDAMIELPRWKNPEDLFRTTQVAVLPRPGFEAAQVKPEFLSRVRVLHSELMDISATEIRRRLHSEQSVQSLIPEAVCNYIMKHNLYI